MYHEPVHMYNYIVLFSHYHGIGIKVSTGLFVPSFCTFALMMYCMYQEYVFCATSGQ